MSKLNKLLLGKNKVTKILAIFAHPDDEAFLCAGILQYLTSNKNYEISLLTVGQSVGLPEKVKIYGEEYKKSLSLIGIQKSAQGNIETGTFHSSAKKVAKLIGNEIRKISPDYILTYDPSGITGNPDHMVVVKEILSFVTKQKQIKLLLRLASTKETNFFKTKYIMSFDPKNHIFFNLTFKEMITKLRAVFAYRHKVKSLLYPLHIIDWFLDETHEDYLVVDKMTKLKYKIVYT